MKSSRTKHIMNEKDEIRRVDKEISRNEGAFKVKQLCNRFGFSKFIVQPCTILITHVST